MKNIVGDKDVVWLVLDALRYDVAQQLFEAQQLPHFARLLPEAGWQHCHAPGSFTLPSHQAFFAGFLPTPINKSKAPRLFAAEFLGSETTSEDTYTFKQAHVIDAFKQQGYRTICIGGVGFFNKQTELSQVLPGFFDESYWEPGFSVTEPASCQNQFKLVKSLLADSKQHERLMLFINISSIHQPNCCYVDGQEHDDLLSHAAALAYVDSQLPVLFEALKGREVFGILCSDHGTAYGEGGYWGHRNAHSTVMEVPYAQFEAAF